MYRAKETRYDNMIYNRCGRSGLKLPALSLGMWHNFGSVNDQENMKRILFEAFDCGITHFDLANNYGPVYGSAEENMGQILKSDLMPYRNEMVISTKAGYDMWKGPYGDGGSRKYLIASLDESLKRLGLEYVDIFYHHRPDPNTPMEETMAALDQIVWSGKALYVGISNYNREQTQEAYHILQEQKTPFIINQVSYSMLNRWIETDGVKDFMHGQGNRLYCFQPFGPGDSHRKISEGNSCGFQGRQREESLSAWWGYIRGKAGKSEGFAGDCPAAGPDSDPDGAGLDFAGWKSDLCADRCQQSGADQGKYSGA